MKYTLLMQLSNDIQLTFHGITEQHVIDIKNSFSIDTNKGALSSTDGNSGITKIVPKREIIFLEFTEEEDA